MKKRHFQKIIIGILSVTMLSSCRIIDAITSRVDDTTSEYTPPSHSEVINDSEDLAKGFRRPGKSKHNYRDLITSQTIDSLPSTGTQNVLVVPVEFTDYPASNLPGGATAARNRIEKAFFGSASETDWQSVKSYYYESSYGKLNITGEVLPWLNIGISSTSLTTKDSNYNPTYLDPTYYVLDVLKEKYPDKLKQYDKDKNGYVDSIFMVYSRPYDKSDLYWAYVFWYQGRTPNKYKPEPCVYGWASYHFLNGYKSLPGSKGIDAHTYIHEFGHILGLDDLYNYDNSPENMSGGIDMMAYNIIDHNMFHKYALDWATPIVPVEDTTIKLRPAHESGDFMIVRNDFIDSAFSEYLLIEYYQPKGLNYKDSHITYPGNGAKGFTENGVRIWHIDARLFKFDYNDNLVNPNNVLTDIEPWDGYYYTDIGASNTPSRSLKSGVHFVHLMEAGGSNTFRTGGTANNNTLFKQGDSFVASSKFFVNGTKFNDGTRVGYRIDIGELTADSATINVTVI